MSNHSSDDDLQRALSLIEQTELPLISQGVVDSALTRGEIDNLLSSWPNATNLFAELERRKLIVEHNGLYRSRMAESVRLMRTLRQSFREQAVTTGTPLVLDYRFVQKPRLRPRLDSSLDELLQIVGTRSEASILAIKTLSHSSMRKFQLNATAEILRSIGGGGHRGVVITAGTGSGKSLAFYLPAFAMISDLLTNDQEPSTKVLAIYPRNELLKDQFANAFSQTYQLSLVAGHRPISIGAWFGPTPSHARSPDVWGSATTEDAVFPFSTCPVPQCGGTLVWARNDRSRDVEKVACRKCETSFDDRFLRLTRSSIQKTPPDILFTTTESLNRQIADAESHRAFGIDAEHHLRLVLLDEAHTYEGTTGAQNAFLFRRFAHLVRHPLVWVGLSATLANPREFMGQLTGLPEGSIEVIQPASTELEHYGGEYLLMLRHDPTQKSSPLSVTIQAAMLMSRVLDTSGSVGRAGGANSGGFFGSRVFLFTDKLDVTNRLFWNLLEAEGWSWPTYPSRMLPKSLAFLRSTSQSEMKAPFKESAGSRDLDGQHWWIAELLGHKVVGVGKQIGRVSSQDQTNVEQADIVVATSTLEVGVSDDAVGAVIQHKAPGSAARFVQRKGRAGRQIDMRPWTVMTVSEWGRDKLAWQLFDQTLDPLVAARNLPLHNRHILKIQAVYATLDWLSLRLSGVGNSSTSSWTDLAGPPKLVFETSVAKQGALSRRQAEAARLVRDVLAFGPEFSDWRTHVRKALAISEDEVDALLVLPPRPLLLGALTAMHRRLTTAWEGETPTETQIKYRLPMPDYIPGSLFADLLTSEVPVVVPPSSTRSGAQSRYESFPVVRVLRDFLPGNISRHYGREKSDRHWIPISIPNPPARVDERFDPRTIYQTVVIGSVTDADGNEISLHLPTNVSLEIAATGTSQLSDGSSISPIWNSDLNPIGVGYKISLDKVVSTRLIRGATAHLHNRGDAFRIRRFVTKGSGRMMGKTFGSHPAVVSFWVDNERVGLGFEYEADGIQIQVTQHEDRPLTSAELLDFVHEAFQTSTDLPDYVTYFERAKLARLCEAVAVRLRLDLPATSAYSSEQILTKVSETIASLDVLGISLLVDDDEHFMRGADELLTEPSVMNVFGDLLAVLAGLVTPNSSVWLQRRFASTVGAALVEAATRLAPNVDTESLQLDLSRDGHFIYLSETEPGGNGNLEELVEEISRGGDLVGQILRSQSEMGEIESLGFSLEQVVRELSSNQGLRSLSSSIIAAWEGGQSIVSPLLAELRSSLQARGITVTPSVMTALTTRFIGPGCNLSGLDLAVAFMDFEDSLTDSLGFTPELSVVHWLAVEKMGETFGHLFPRPLDADHRRREIEQRSWPRLRNAARYDLAARGQFERLPMADRNLLTEALESAIVSISLAATTDNEIADLLLSNGEIELSASETDATKVRDLIIRTQATPMEMHGLFIYPKVAGVTVINGQIRVRLTIEEGVEWSA